jgi:outer membrane protein OmpA-like peptidoglycan-associated protein
MTGLSPNTAYSIAVAAVISGSETVRSVAAASTLPAPRALAPVPVAASAALHLTGRAAIERAITRLGELAVPNTITPGIVLQAKGAAEDPGCPWEQTGAVCLRAMEFDYDRAEIGAAADASLKELADFLKANPNASVELQGHADTHGTEAYNDKLSEKRAGAVLNRLTGKGGVAVARFKTKAYGKTLPIDATGAEEGRAKNRRVLAVLRWLNLSK